MSDTPRTDDQEGWILSEGGRYSVVGSHFARDLERELAAAKERIRRLEEALDLCDASFGRFGPLQHSRYGDCWAEVRAALRRPNPHPEEDKP